MQGSNSTGGQPGGPCHKAQEPALVCSIQLCQDVQEEADGSAGGSVAVVELDGVCQSLHTPLLAGAAHHGFDLILKETLEGVQWEDLVEASPAYSEQLLDFFQFGFSVCLRGSASLSKWSSSVISLERPLPICSISWSEDQCVAAELECLQVARMKDRLLSVNFKKESLVCSAHQQRDKMGDFTMNCMQELSLYYCLSKHDVAPCA